MNPDPGMKEQEPPAPQSGATLKWVRCPKCGGDGYDHRKIELSACPECQGNGGSHCHVPAQPPSETAEVKCPHCHGTKIIPGPLFEPPEECSHCAYDGPPEATAPAPKPEHAGTPRTDDNMQTWENDMGETVLEFVDPEFARTLERELQQKDARIAELERDVAGSDKMVRKYANELQQLCEIICGGPTVARFSSVKERLEDILRERERLREALSAAGRLRKMQYLPWDRAGGPNECRHGRADGIPCLQCDEAALDAALIPGGIEEKAPADTQPPTTND